VETGDNINDLMGEETLVLVNHQSTGDVPLLMHNFSCKNTLLHRLNWVMDAVFQFTNFGIVSTLHGDFFINAVRALSHYFFNLIEINHKILLVGVLLFVGT